MNDKPEQTRPEMWVAIRRALFGKCPNCGRGQLYISYLRAVDRCPICKEPYGHIRSDDAAPWLTILVVGIFAVPIVLAIESRTSWPLWVSLSIWLSLAVVLTLIVLPRVKAVLIGLIWLSRTQDSERESE